MLVRLEELMANFVPPRPDPVPEPPDACLTAIASQNDPIAARIERGLLADYRQRRQQAQQAALEAEQNFNETVRPVAWTWLRVWLEGQSITVAQPVMGCWEYGYWGNNRNCYGEWRVRRPAVVVTSEPELTRRVRQDGRLHPENDLYCSVEQAVRDGEQVILTCSGPQVAEQFFIEVPAVLGSADGALRDLGVGDLVKVQGHLAITRRFSRDSAQWRVRDVPDDGAVIVERSTCCHPPEQAPEAAAEAAQP